MFNLCSYNRHCLSNVFLNQVINFISQTNFYSFSDRPEAY
jgi:hypothetical protein